jgi:hypothetical protein
MARDMPKPVKYLIIVEAAYMSRIPFTPILNISVVFFGNGGITKFLYYLNYGINHLFLPYS